MKKTIIVLMIGFSFLSLITQAQSYQNLTPSLQQIATPNSEPGWIYFKDSKAANTGNVFLVYKNNFDLGADDAMSILKEETDRIGTNNVWYQQYYKGLKVEGCQYIAHSQNSNLYLANGKICTGLNMNINPGISGVSAINFAKSYVNATLYKWDDPNSEQELKQFKNDNAATYYPVPELVIAMNGTDLPLLPANFKLAYKIDIRTKIPESANTLYIDANNGSLIKVIPLAISCTPGKSQTMFMGNQPINTSYYFGSFQYTLYDPCKAGGFRTRLNNFGPVGDVYNNNDDWSTNVAEKAMGQAHWATDKFYDYMLTNHGRKSYDNNNAEMMCMIDQGSTDNATWEATWLFTRYFKSGVNGQPNTYWVANDIVGHEWGHAVTQFASGLQYIGESGAINEAYSDIWGTLFEYYAQSGIGDWTIAEDVYVSGTSFPNYLRSMSNPQICGNPNSYNGTFYSTGCNPVFFSGPMPPGCGDPHNRSGVMNYWFYLLSQGGTGTNNAPIPYTYNVTGIGMASAGQIAYRAYNYLTTTSQFIDARNATIQAARDLFGECSNQVAQVREAWSAVGVYATAPSCMNVCVNKFNATCTTNNGSANVTVSGGVSPYTYQWYNAVGNTPITGATTSNISNLAPGTYYVVVQDNAFCSKQSLNFIILGGTPNLSFTSTNANCTGPNGDGSATVVPSGGLAPYLYQWNSTANNQTTPTASNLQAGTYNVTVTDANGCGAVGSTVVNPNLVVFTIPYGFQITGNVTWNAPLIKVDGFAEVNPGAVLTIANGTKVEFIHHPDPLDPMPYGVARLIVDPGGFLNVSQTATLTGCSGGIWDGIEVLGTGIFNVGFAQANIYGQIENADIGVYNAGRPKINQSIVNNWGGVIYANTARFINCRTGIVLTRNILGYNYNIIGNTFVLDKRSKYMSSYNPLNNDMPVQIYAAENIITTIQGNKFCGGINDFAGDFRGTAIVCNDCKPDINNSGGYGSNIFGGLTKGIEANFAYTSNQLKSTGNLFKDCQQAIFLQGSSLAQLKNNTFEVPKPISPNTKSYGLFAVNSSGFDISGNIVDPVQADNNSYGFVIESSGATGGVIFNNTFNNIGIGLQAQKANQNLKVGCNTFNNPVNLSAAVVNVIGFPTSTMKQQGLGCTSNGDPAGNEWPYNCNTSTSNANIFADAGVTFKYYSYNQNQSSQPYTKPLCSSPIWKAADMVPYICNSLNKNATSCNAVFPLPPPPPNTTYPNYYLAIKNLTQTYENEINALQVQYKTALTSQDGGNTQNLLNAINQTPALSDGQLKALLNSSGALSDKVIIALIQRNPPVSPGVLKDILNPQAPLSVAVLTALENLSVPKGIKSNIYTAQSNLPQYIKADAILGDINYLRGEIILLENEFQRTKLDEMGKICPDCKFSGTTNVDLLAAQDFATKNMPDSLRARLGVIIPDTLMDQTEKQNFVDYMTTIADLLDANKNIYSASNAQIADIQNVALTNTKAGAHANAGLKLRKLSNYTYFIADIPSNNQRLFNNSEETREETVQMSNTGVFILYPNPTNGNFYIQTKLTDYKTPITVTVVNLLGQTLFTVETLASESVKILVKDPDLAKGVYLVNIAQNNINIGQSKLVVE